MSRIFTVLLMMAALLVAQAAGTAPDHDGVGGASRDAAAAIVAPGVAQDGVALVTPDPAGHGHDAADHCLFSSCTVTFMVGRDAAAIALPAEASSRWALIDDQAVRAAAPGKDPPVPRLSV